MATTSIPDSKPGSQAYATTQQLNVTLADLADLAADVDLIRTAVNAIITAAATNIAAVAAVTPAAAATFSGDAVPVGNKAGTAFS